MNYSEFINSTKGNTLPGGINRYLEALWYDKKGNWHQAHEIAQDIHDPDGSWIHAYLHRKEGDLGNASYWYSRAGKPVFKGSLDDEWEQMAKAFIQ